MDVKSFLKIFEWMLYALVVCGAICAGILIALIFAIWSWMS